MQMVKRGLLLFLLLWAGVIVFMPKESLYFALEKRLAKEGIEINEAKIEEGLFGLTLRQPVIYVEGIKVARVQKIRMYTLLFYTSIKAENIEVEKGFHRYVPAKVEKVWFIHTLLHPLEISVTVKGSFGTITGMIDLKKHKIHLDVTHPEKLGILQREIKKNKKGWYYETSF